MRIDILSAVPDLMQSFFAHSILKRAQDRGLLEVHLHNIHDYSKKKFKFWVFFLLNNFMYGKLFQKKKFYFFKILLKMKFMLIIKFMNMLKTLYLQQEIQMNMR